MNRSGSGVVKRNPDGRDEVALKFHLLDGQDDGLPNPSIRIGRADIFRDDARIGLVADKGFVLALELEDDFLAIVEVLDFDGSNGDPGGTTLQVLGL